MNTNINILNFNKHFSQNIQENSENKFDENKKIIVSKSFFSINEANICYKIKKIPYYSNYFSILEDYEILNVSQINDVIHEKAQYNENIQYYLFHYTYNNSIDFIDYLYNFISIPHLVFNIINTFSHLFSGLHILNQNNICFFNISPNNILFHKNYREKPVLCNFHMSLRLNKMNFNYISTILNKLDDFTYQPLEIQILFYIIKNDMTTISYSFIEEFTEVFIEKISILRLFSDKYKKAYKEKCIEQLKKYTNLPKKDIIGDILERNDKWDVYGISMLYIHVFGCISRVFSLKDKFINKITLELTKNLHPDPEKRMSLEETLFQFNKLLNDEEDWSFINSLDNNRMELLLDELSK